MSKAPSRSQDQFIVRLPDGMRDRIKAAAEASGRSMNAEIVAALDERYPEPFKTGNLRAAYEEAVTSTQELETAIRRWLRQREQARNYKSDYPKPDEQI